MAMGSTETGPMVTSLTERMKLCTRMLSHVSWVELAPTTGRTKIPQVLIGRRLDLGAKEGLGGVTPHTLESRPYSQSCGPSSQFR
ncbi:unnamed protein product [Linum trigynum]|uniref:Uncharacterized protein n=1 Tax=Linum trigynum TaxID=586398 RepID=A0AAV2G4Z3_9ROSI